MGSHVFLCIHIIYWLTTTSIVPNSFREIDCAKASFECPFINSWADWEATEALELRREKLGTRVKFHSSSWQYMLQRISKLFSYDSLIPNWSRVNMKPIWVWYFFLHIYKKIFQGFNFSSWPLSSFMPFFSWKQMPQQPLQKWWNVFRQSQLLHLLLLSGILRNQLWK